MFLLNVSKSHLTYKNIFKISLVLILLVIQGDAFTECVLYEKGQCMLLHSGLRVVPYHNSEPFDMVNSFQSEIAYRAMASVYCLTMSVFERLLCIFLNSDSFFNV